MNQNIWTQTNAKQIATVTCATMLAAGAAAVYSAPQEINASTSFSCPVGMVYESVETSIDPALARWVEFQTLRRQWLQERGARASAADMAMTPSYLNIIGMGPDVVPDILRQLRSEGDRPEHWFFALAAITRDNPVPLQSRGKVREMAKAWLEWGQTKEYV